MSPVSAVCHQWSSIYICMYFILEGQVRLTLTPMMTVMMKLGRDTENDHVLAHAIDVLKQ